MEADTVLHWAAYAGQTDLIQFQRRFELNPAQVDTFDQTPLHKARVKGSVNTVREALKQIEGCVTHWPAAENRSLIQAGWCPFSKTDGFEVFAKL